MKSRKLLASLISLSIVMACCPSLVFADEETQNDASEEAVEESVESAVETDTIEETYESEEYEEAEESYDVMESETSADPSETIAEESSTETSVTDEICYTGETAISEQVSEIEESEFLVDEECMDVEADDLLIEVNEETFPDPIFREYVLNHYDSDKDQRLSIDECLSVSLVDVHGMDINDLKGIEFFSNIETLYCYNNPLTELDVQSLNLLYELNIYQTQITDLDVSGRECLKILSLNSAITNVDASGCAALKTLYFNDSPYIESLILSGCTSMTSLSRNTSYSITIEELDVEGCTSLKSIELENVGLRHINLSGCSSLYTLDVSFNHLTELDLYDCKSLVNLKCEDNYIVDLDLRGLASLSLSGSNIRYIGSAYLKNLNLSGCTWIRNLDFIWFNSNVKLDTLDVSECTNLETISCYGLSLKCLDLTGCTGLTELNCANNKLTELDISGMRQLKTVDCYNNNLETILLSKCSNLKELKCYNNNLTSLDVSECPYLETLDLRKNNIRTLDTTNNKYLRSLRVDDNGLVDFQYDHLPSTLTGWDAGNPGQLSKPVFSSISVNGFKTATLCWGDVHGADGYEIEQSVAVDTGYSVIGRTTSLTLDVSNLVSGCSYYFRVRAYRIENNTRVYSDYSDVVCGVPEASKPLGVMASMVNSSEWMVSWDGVDGADGYEIAQAIADEGGYSVIGTVSSLDTQIVAPQYGVTFYIKVRAYKLNGADKVYSDYSNAVSLKATVPVPDGLMATASSTTTISLKWNPIKAPSSGTMIYEIWRNTGTSGIGTCIGKYTEQSSVSKLLNPNTTYYYRVRAYWISPSGSKVYGGYSNWVSAKTQFALSEPTGVYITATDTSTLKIYWSKVDGATGYEVFRSTSLNGSYTSIGKTTNLYMTNSVGRGTVYYYKVAAYSGSTYSPYSSAMPALIPATPTGLRVSSSTRNTINLSWNKISTTAPGNGQIFYEVFRLPSRTASKPYTCIGIYDQNRTYNTSYNLAAGTSYYYCIRAYYRYTDSNGTTRRIYGNYSSIVQGTTRK